MKKIRKEYYFIALLLICFITLTLFVTFGKTYAFDENAFNTIIKIKNVPLTEFLRVITHMASTIGIISLLLLVSIIFYRKKAFSDFKYVFINVASGILLRNLITIIVRRTRPVWKWIDQDGFCYPSGHTISAFLLYGTLFLLVYKKVHGKFRKPLLVGFTLMAILTGISRIYFGAHYVTDVVGSMLLGIIILIISNMFMNKEFNSGNNKIKK